MLKESSGFILKTFNAVVPRSTSVVFPMPAVTFTDRSETFFSAELL